MLSYTYINCFILFKNFKNSYILIFLRGKNTHIVGICNRSKHSRNALVHRTLIYKNILEYISLPALHTTIRSEPSRAEPGEANIKIFAGAMTKEMEKEEWMQWMIDSMMPYSLELEQLDTQVSSIDVGAPNQSNDDLKCKEVLCIDDNDDIESLRIYETFKLSRNIGKRRNHSIFPLAPKKRKLHSLMSGERKNNNAEVVASSFGSTLCGSDGTQYEEGQCQLQADASSSVVHHNDYDSSNYQTKPFQMPVECRHEEYSFVGKCYREKRSLYLKYHRRFRLETHVEMISDASINSAFSLMSCGLATTYMSQVEPISSDMSSSDEKKDIMDELSSADKVSTSTGVKRCPFMVGSASVYENVLPSNCILRTFIVDEETNKMVSMDELMFEIRKCALIRRCKTSEEADLLLSSLQLPSEPGDRFSHQAQFSQYAMSCERDLDIGNKKYSFDEDEVYFKQLASALFPTSEGLSDKWKQQILGDVDLTIQCGSLFRGKYYPSCAANMLPLKTTPRVDIERPVHHNVIFQQCDAILYATERKMLCQTLHYQPSYGLPTYSHRKGDGQYKRDLQSFVMNLHEPNSLSLITANMCHLKHNRYFQIQEHQYHDGFRAPSVVDAIGMENAFLNSETYHKKQKMDSIKGTTYSKVAKGDSEQASFRIHSGTMEVALSEVVIRKEGLRAQKLTYMWRNEEVLKRQSIQEATESVLPPYKNNNTNIIHHDIQHCDDNISYARMDISQRNMDQESACAGFSCLKMQALIPFVNEKGEREYVDVAQMTGGLIVIKPYVTNMFVLKENQYLDTISEYNRIAQENARTIRKMVPTPRHRDLQVLFAKSCSMYGFSITDKVMSWTFDLDVKTISVLFVALPLMCATFPLLPSFMQAQAFLRAMLTTMVREKNFDLKALWQYDTELTACVPSIAMYSKCHREMHSIHPIPHTRNEKEFFLTSSSPISSIKPFGTMIENYLIHYVNRYSEQKMAQLVLFKSDMNFQPKESQGTHPNFLEAIHCVLHFMYCKKMPNRKYDGDTTLMVQQKSNHVLINRNAKSPVFVAHSASSSFIKDNFKERCTETNPKECGSISSENQCERSSLIENTHLIRSMLSLKIGHIALLCRWYGDACIVDMLRQISKSSALWVEQFVCICIIVCCKMSYSELQLRMSAESSV